MAQQSEKQFENDLTIGLDKDDAFSTDSIDLFEFASGNESPVARLKTIILSIDWEITDEILQELDNELIDLADIWENDKIKLIYVRALKTVGRYIHKEKASAHQNAIKILIAFYHNLEKIISFEDEMSTDEKKEILMNDLKKYERLKLEIGEISANSDIQREIVPSLAKGSLGKTPHDSSELKTLKAGILGLDWEVNDHELQKLSEEVTRLESVFSQSKGKLILLQGIGALCSYIYKNKSNSHNDAFVLLRSFYDVLEKIPSGHLPSGGDKESLLAEVAKFKAFKGKIAQDNGSKPAVVANGSSESNIPQDEESDEVSADIESRLSSVFGEGDVKNDIPNVDKSSALEGVNVETEADDDSEEEALPFIQGGVAPALSEVDEQSSFSVEKLAGDLAKSIELEEQTTKIPVSEKPIPGVDVETNADDDSEEEALPFYDGEVAPALSGSEDDSEFDQAMLDAEIDAPGNEDLNDRLDSFFDDEVQASSDLLAGGGQNKVGLDSDEGSIVASLSDLDDDTVVPALSESGDSFLQENEENTILEDGLSIFDDDVPAPALGNVSTETEEDFSFLDDDTLESEQTIDSESDVDEEIAAFFDESAPMPALFEETESCDKEPTEEFEMGGEIVAPELDIQEELHLDELGTASDAGWPQSVPDEGPLDVIEKKIEEQPSMKDELEENLLSFFDEESESSELVEELTEFVELDEDSGVELEDEIEDVALTASGAAISSVVTSSFVSEESHQPVVFEVVADDVEIDPLPGEVLLDIEDPEKEKSFALLKNAVLKVKNEMSIDTVQVLLAAVNRERTRNSTNTTGKIYLQLLSTVSQYIERNKDNIADESLLLLDDVCSGIQLSSRVDLSPEHVQQHLLKCTSQVLLLQQREIG